MKKLKNVYYAGMIIFALAQIIVLALLLTTVQIDLGLGIFWCMILSICEIVFITLFLRDLK